MICRAALCGTCLLAVGLLGGCGRPGQVAGGNEADGNGTAAALPALPASLPMQSGPATAPLAAPVASALPAAPRPPLRRFAQPSGSYAYLDRAASYGDAIGDAPPDYAFDYDGVSPWGWQADDGSVEYAEPIDGGYRSYYYQPGAETPYLVRDPYYSYAFDGAALVLVYDRFGRAVPPGAYGPRWDWAGRYYARGQALRAAAQANRRGVNAANWAARRAEIAAANASWDAARARDAAWAAYHDRTAGRQQAYWRGERDARAEATRQFVTDQRRGFGGPPPGPPRDGPPQADAMRPPFVRPSGPRPAPVAERQRPDVPVRAGAGGRQDADRAASSAPRFAAPPRLPSAREQGWHHRPDAARVAHDENGPAPGQVRVWRAGSDQARTPQQIRIDADRRAGEGRRFGDAEHTAPDRAAAGRETSPDFARFQQHDVASPPARPARPPDLGQRDTPHRAPPSFSEHPSDHRSAPPVHSDAPSHPSMAPQHVEHAPAPASHVAAPVASHPSGGGDHGHDHGHH